MNRQTVLLKKRAGIFTITLNVPQKLNAMSDQLLRDLNDALEECATSEEIKVLIVTGAGRAFCAGADLSDVAGQASGFTNSLASDAQRKSALKSKMDTEFNMVIKRLLDMPVPTISAVNGIAAGGGYGLALACDIVLATESAQFILVFTRQLGLIPDIGATWHAPRTLGRARAMASSFFGEPISAADAARCGLIWKSVGDSEFKSAVDAAADILSAGATKAYVATRKAIDQAFVNTLSEQLDLEAELQPVLSLTDDFEEGVRAFLEKRSPRFKGR